MAYFNHAFAKLFIGTHPTQAADGSHSGVTTGFLVTSGVPSVQLINRASPYQLGLGVFGLFDPKTYLSVVAADAQITTGAPLILASTALYQHDKIGPFHGGYQESTKSKMINPKYVNRFYRVDPCTPNQNVVHVGNTPYTNGGGVASVTITDAGTGYTNGTYTNIVLTGAVGNGALATVTVAGGAITAVAITAPGSFYDVGNVLGVTGITFTPGTAAVLTVAAITAVTDVTCCKEFLCDETYFLRVDVKGSPELRYLSRNGYWTTASYTGCCPAGCGTPVPVDSTLVFIGWANELLANRIVGPFLNIVIYDENGVGWYAPGQDIKVGDTGGFDLSPGVGAATITNAGSGYNNGTFTNVTFQSSGSGVGAVATVTVAGGVVTAVVFNNPGLSYAVGDTLTSPLLSPGTGLVLTVTATVTPTWDNYVSPGHIDGACAGMKIMGAFIDTKFGDCTFYPTDYFEKEPVKILPSEVDETGDVCAFTGLCIVEQCPPRQGMGFGEQVLRDLILSESYMQNYFYTGEDLRIREVTQGYDISSAIIRSAQYYRYFILHSVPRFNNPTGVFDNDQYLLEIITTAVSATFESTMATWLTACNCSIALETYACGAACPGACAILTFVPTAGAVSGGTVDIPYVFTPIAVSGGTAPYSFEVTAGALPPGLVLGATTGDITGTPTTTGTYEFTVSVVDTNGCQTNVVYSITVVEAG